MSLIPSLETVQAELLAIEAEREAIDAEQLAAIMAKRAEHRSREYDYLKGIEKLLAPKTRKPRGPNKPKGAAPAPLPLLDQNPARHPPEPEPAATGTTPAVSEVTMPTAPSEPAAVTLLNDDELDEIFGTSEPAEARDDPDAPAPTVEVFECCSCGRHRPCLYHPCHWCGDDEYRLVRVSESDADDLKRYFAETPKPAAKASESPAAPPASVFAETPADPVREQIRATRGKKAHA